MRTIVFKNLHIGELVLVLLCSWNLFHERFASVERLQVFAQFFGLVGVHLSNFRLATGLLHFVDAGMGVVYGSYIAIETKLLNHCTCPSDESLLLKC